MVRVVVLSDTHNRHSKFEVPAGDVLIHCGDMTNRGSAPELAEFDAWLAGLPHAHKLVVCGNMDQRLESCASKEVRQRLLPSAQYLEDDATEVAGLRIYGSPYTPKFSGAWQLANEAEAESKWAAVPEGLDILVTHGPPRDILDAVGRGQSATRAGCAALRRHVRRARPRYHFFGHIHEEGGRQLDDEGTTFANAAQHVMVFDIVPSGAFAVGPGVESDDGEASDGEAGVRQRSRSRGK